MLAGQADQPHQHAHAGDAAPGQHRFGPAAATKPVLLKWPVTCLPADLQLERAIGKEQAERDLRIVAPFTFMIPGTNDASANAG